MLFICKWFNFGAGDDKTQVRDFNRSVHYQLPKRELMEKNNTGKNPTYVQAKNSGFYALHGVPCKSSFFFLLLFLIEWKTNKEKHHGHGGFQQQNPQ